MGKATKVDKQSKTLSVAVMDKLAAKAAPYRVWDTKVPALFVRVQPSGVKSFNVQWSRASSKGLGKYPTTTVEGARAKAIRILADANSATDGVPQAAKPKPKSDTTTLRAFVTGDYADFARAELLHGQAAVDRILGAFGKLADKPLAAIDRKAIEAVITTRRNKQGLQPSTTNRDLAALKAALAKAVDWQLLTKHPAQEIENGKLKEGVTRYLSDAEEGRLLAALAARDEAARIARDRTLAAGRAQHADLQALPAGAYCDHLTPFVLTALHTGCRRGELTSLRWADVDLKGARITVRGTSSKSGKTRHVPLNREALRVLTAWQAQGSGEGRVFGVGDIKKAWGNLLTAAKVKDFRLHDLRHTFASKLVMASVDLNTVRELLGHSDIKMTLRYAHLAPEHKAAAVELLVKPEPSNVTPIRRKAS